MSTKSIRWKQRFKNLERVIMQLNEAEKVIEPSKLEKSCIRQNYIPLLNALYERLHTEL